MARDWDVLESPSARGNVLLPAKNTKLIMHRNMTIKQLLASAFLAFVAFMAQAQINPADYSVPELDGAPELGQWYTITPAEAVCATGVPATGLIRKGSENKVMIVLYGGGVSVDPFTAARGESAVQEHSFYSDHMDVSAAGVVQVLFAITMGAPVDTNPFKDWTFIAIPYATGDFHAGTGEYPYVGLDGENHILYHNGFTNLNLILQKVLPYLGTPEALFITGFSAGGFGTALVSDCVIDYFPKTRNITCFVDSAHLLYKDWRNVARNVWKAPKRIWKYLKSDDIVLDALSALHKKRPEVKILFGCSVRDYALSNYQRYLDTGDNTTTTADDGDVFQRNLKGFCEGFRKNIPEGGLFIWDGFPAAGQDATLTHHCIELSGQFFTDMRGHGNFATWMNDAVEGRVHTYGLELLDNDYRPKTVEGEKIRLYDGPAPGTEDWTQTERWNGTYGNRMAWNVTVPELEVFTPEEGKANGSALIVCPGGGFCFLSYDNEGVGVARKLVEQGITAFVLKYRTHPFFKPDGGDYTGEGEMMLDYFVRLLFPLRSQLAERKGVPADEVEISETLENFEDCKWAFADAERAMSLVRSRAAEWNIDTSKIGIIGFSAGSMTALNQALHHSAESRPDFVAAIYTGVADGFEVPADAAPLFLCSPVNDVFLPQESIRAFLAWKKAGVPVEHHFFSKCGHGYGSTPQGTSVDQWMNLLFGFMKDVNFIN